MPKRMRGLYKRGNVWWCCYKALTGKIVRQTTEKTEYEDAVTFLMQKKAEVKLGKEPDLKRIVNHTFKELAAEYLVWAERQRSFPSKKIWIAQLTERFGDMPLRQFSSRLIEQFQTERLQEGRKRKVMKKDKHGRRVPTELDDTPRGNKPATVNRLLATIKHMFTKAVEWEMVEEETLKKVHKVKFLEENNRRLRYLSTEECRNLIEACNPHLKPIVITAVNTGMRRGEILTLKWDQVDLRHGFILLETTKNGDRRQIPINSTLRDTLQTMVIRRLDVPYLFHDHGKPYDDVKKGFKAACKRAGLTDLHFHDLRHTFASQLVMAGVDLTTVKSLLGHKTLSMTLRYAHLAPSHEVKAVDILDKSLNKKSTSHLLHNFLGDTKESSA